MMNRRDAMLHGILCLMAVFFLTGCGTDRTLLPSEGYVNVEGGRIWYKVTGEGDQLPLVLLHGGPGAPSWYLKPLEALGRERPLIFYDQLGCGRSDYITDTALMTVEHQILLSTSKPLRLIMTILSSGTGHGHRRWTVLWEQ